MNRSTQSESARQGDRFRCDPHPLLQDKVIEYWALARDLGAMGGFVITPDCYGELICCADELFARFGPDRFKLPSCFLLGLLEGPVRIESPGRVRCFAARLRAQAIGRLLLETDDQGGRPWRSAEGMFSARLGLAIELTASCDWHALRPIFDDLLMRIFAGDSAPAPGEDPAAPFLRDRGRSTAEVARGLSASTRQVQRRVRALTGTSPGRLAALARFQKVRDAIWANPSISLAQLACDAGYADQPHMTREFRRFAGRTPAAFTREIAAEPR